MTITIYVECIKHVMDSEVEHLLTWYSYERLQKLHSSVQIPIDSPN